MALPLSNMPQTRQPHAPRKLCTTCSDHAEHRRRTHTVRGFIYNGIMVDSIHGGFVVGSATRWPYAYVNLQQNAGRISIYKTSMPINRPGPLHLSNMLHRRWHMPQTSLPHAHGKLAGTCSNHARVGLRKQNVCVSLHNYIVFDSIHGDLCARSATRWRDAYVNLSQNDSGVSTCKTLLRIYNGIVVDSIHARFVVGSATRWHYAYVNLHQNAGCISIYKTSLPLTRHGPLHLSNMLHRRWRSFLKRATNKAATRARKTCWNVLQRH